MKKKVGTQVHADNSPAKKLKLDKSDEAKSKQEKNGKFSKKFHNKPDKNGKGKGKSNMQILGEKPEDWMEFKKQKKELKLKRKQTRAGDGFDVITKAKLMGEKLRRKKLQGGEEERVKLINELHTILKNNDQYAKFALAHDTARIVQWLLKYSSDFVIRQISKDLIPVTVDMLQSKYGIYCVKRLLKYGSHETRSEVIQAMLGNAIKLTNHVISAPVVEYAFSTWATPQQKQFLVQEFYGDLYKNSKDKEIKHLRDVYKNDNTLKAATLGATKANLNKVLNKNLLDSGLVQTVLYQYLTECSEDDRSELISALAPHVVVISNSKDGARAAMECIWHGANKDKKVIIKALNKHIIELAKHEYGHCTIIAVLDATDDTVLLHKILLSEILKNARDLAVSEWGRKVLLWLVSPEDTNVFHPTFIKELKAGREAATCKKAPEIRQKEIRTYAIATLLGLVENEPEFWLSNGSLAIEMLTIIKNGSGVELQKALKSIVKVITNLDWKLTNDKLEVLGIEHGAIHMALKKMAQHDKTVENQTSTFGAHLVEVLDDKVLAAWIPLNRGCFLLVSVFENNAPETQKILKKKLEKQKKLLKSQSTQGAKILLNKLT